MGTLWGDNGKVAYGTYKSFTINMPTPQETLLTGGNVVTLSTTEQTSGGSVVSYTIQESDLPTFSGGGPLNLKYAAVIHVGGRIGAATTTISYRVLKNSTSVVTSSNASLGATLYWTHSHQRFLDVKVGDVLEVRTWANQADAALDYFSLIIFPTQMAVTKPGVFLKDLVFGAGSLYPTFTQGTPAQASTSNFLVVPSSNVSQAINISTSATTFYGFMQQPTYQTGRCGFGDATLTSSIYTHTSNRPGYYRNYIPSSISFREVLR